ncbi:MAG: M23 family metallopeptidase [Culicoidibacterales bacterium]
MILVVSMMPSFVGQQQGAQQNGIIDQQYQDILNQYQQVSIEFLNEKNVQIPLSELIALDMLVLENNFTKVTKEHIRKQAEYYIKSEERTITYEEHVIKERWVTKQRPKKELIYVPAQQKVTGITTYCPSGSDKMWYWILEKDRCRKDVKPEKPEWWIGKYEWSDLLEKPSHELWCQEGILKNVQCELTKTTMESYQELEQYEVIETRTEQQIIWLVKTKDEQKLMLKQKFPKFFDSSQTKNMSDADIHFSYYEGLIGTIQTLVFAQQPGEDIIPPPSDNGVIVVKGTFVIPIDKRDSPQVTAGWGLYDPYDNGNLKFHQATDWAGKSNARIIASASGTVSKVVNHCVEGNSSCGNGFGNQVIITHLIDGKTYQTVYGHLANVSIHQGEKVNQGQIIGIQGNTGASNGAHVHFELHQPQFQYRIDTHTPAISALNPLTMIKTQ